MKRQHSSFPRDHGRIHSRSAWVAAMLLAMASGAYWWTQHKGDAHESTLSASVAKAGKVGQDLVQLSAEQVPELKSGPVQALRFEPSRDAVGVIDVNQDRTVQVSPPYQGRVGQVAVKTGDDVAAQQLLYTVQVPELAQAAASLISASGVLRNANDVLARARNLYESQSISQKELQQNQADQQAAEAGYRAARKALSLFGLTEQDLEQIEAGRKVDAEMPVRSPLAGRVTSRQAVPGQLVQPGTAPAPISVSDLTHLWLVASVPESEIALYQRGQKVSVTVPAYPQQRFNADLVYIGDTSDPVTHRVALRAELHDATRRLKPQMMASFQIALGGGRTSPALPVNALTRESDGSFSVWVEQQAGQFKRRSVQVGITQDGLVQVLQGLQAGERVAQDKALFLSNLYATATH